MLSRGWAGQCASQVLGQLAVTKWMTEEKERVPVSIKNSYTCRPRPYIYDNNHNYWLRYERVCNMTFHCIQSNHMYVLYVVVNDWFTMEIRPTYIILILFLDWLNWLKNAESETHHLINHACYLCTIIYLSVWTRLYLHFMWFGMIAEPIWQNFSEGSLCKTFLMGAAMIAMTSLLNN